MEGRISPRPRDARPFGAHRLFAWSHRRALRNGLALGRGSLHAPCQLAFHAHCHLADEQAFDGNPAAKCGPEKPRTDPGMGQIARGAGWSRRHRDRAFPLGFDTGSAGGFAVIDWASSWAATTG